MAWKNNTYTESVGGFYIEENSNSLVAIGDKFHYIFKTDGKLIDILKLSESISYKPIFFGFKVDDKNRISGTLSIVADKNNLTDQYMNSLINLGFVSIENSLFYSEEIHGDRYKIEGNFSDVVNFDKSFKVEVSVPLTGTDIAKNIMVSPVTLVADVAIVTLAIPLGVLYGVSMNF